MDMNKTLSYYEKNAKIFAEQTLAVDFSATQDKFLGEIPAGAHILDFGCGSGRDSKYFLEKGYAVTAIDGSSELCSIASDYTGMKVKQMLFQDLNETEVYDGIWACASVLHLQIEPLADVFGRMSRAVKNGGIIYVSFKYGSFDGERHGRWFTNFTEEKFTGFLQVFSELSIEEMWKSSDVRAGREDEKWLNIILRKTVSC